MRVAKELVGIHQASRGGKCISCKVSRISQTKEARNSNFMKNKGIGTREFSNP